PRDHTAVQDSNNDGHDFIAMQRADTGVLAFRNDKCRKLVTELDIIQHVPEVVLVGDQCRVLECEQAVEGQGLKRCISDGQQTEIEFVQCAAFVGLFWVLELCEKSQVQMETISSVLGGL